MSKKLYLGLNIIACLLVGLAGCAAKEPPKEPLTLTFAFLESNDRQLYASIVADFQEIHPEITIQLQPDPGGLRIKDEQYSVDAFAWPPDPTLTQGDKAQALKLSPLLDATPGLSLDDFYSSLSWDDAVWALPAEVDVRVLYYNKDIFDEENVPYPQAGWKWDDLLRTAQLLTAVQGQEPERSGHFGLVSEPLPDVIAFIFQHGGQPLDFDDPLTEQALQWYADLALKHGVMPQADDRWLNKWGTHGMFSTQQAAMMIGFLHQRSDRNNIQWNFEWGVAPLPGDQTEATYTHIGSGYYISAHSPHPQEAWEWTQFLTLHPVGRAIPARRSVATQQGFRELVGEEVMDTALYALEHSVPPIETASIPPQTIQAYASLIMSVVQGKLTAAEAMSALRDASQE